MRVYETAEQAIDQSTKYAIMTLCTNTEENVRYLENNCNGSDGCEYWFNDPDNNGTDNKALWCVSIKVDLTPIRQFPKQLEDNMVDDKLTITLTAQPPVRIVKTDWPVIARAFHHDGQIESQANRRSRLSVRRHSDGRMIVYGTYKTSWQGERDRAGGVILHIGVADQLVTAIKAVGDRLGFSQDLIDECIADLPVEDIQPHDNDVPDTLGSPGTKLYPEEFNMAEQTNPPEAGEWTLVSPSGRRFRADSPLKCCVAEQKERVPAKVAVSRIMKLVSEEPAGEQGGLTFETNRDHRQFSVLEWANRVFGEPTASNKVERILRFAEEALETIQAAGLDRRRAQDILDYVYARQAGDIAQEIGQAGVSLLALAQYLGVSAEQEEAKEFERLTSLPDVYWRGRQEAKAAKGAALPVSINPVVPPEPVCEKCGGQFDSNHEDATSTQCRWCVTGWKESRSQEDYGLFTGRRSSLGDNPE